ncbi:hypothetical protein HOD19_00375 [bacterium]|jgi:hypothetical protein|nr:hypothetical protein [bacterium]MBT4649271.1 hypothetical protein [bacterium]
MTAFNFKKSKPAKKKRSMPQKKVNAKDLIDPVLYVGGLDPEKYPNLAQDKEEKVEEEIENPLNKR